MSAPKPNSMYNSAAAKKIEELKKVNTGDKTNAAGEQQIENLIKVPTECIPVNIPLPCTVYKETHGKYLVFRRQGEKINYKQALEMQKADTTEVFIHKAVWLMLKESLKDLAIPQSETNESEQIVYMRHLLLAYGNELEKKQKEDQRPIIEKMKKQGEMIAEALVKSPKSAGQLLRPSSTAENFFVNHPINVCIWSVLIAQKMGIKESDIKTIGAAAFMHDVGNLWVPKRILMKKEKMTEDEEESFQSHARKGAEFVNEHGFAPILATIIDQHQERSDGSGYPNKLMDKDIHPFAKIVIVADEFDTLASTNPQTQGLPANQALEEMKKKPGRFDAKVLHALSELVSAG